MRLVQKEPFPSGALLRRNQKIVTTVVRGRSKFNCPVLSARAAQIPMKHTARRHPQLVRLPQPVAFFGQVAQSNAAQVGY
jgi:hypothetical protein